MIQDFFRLQGIKVLWRLQFLEYLKARTKFEVVLPCPALPCWLSQLNWDSQQGRLRTTSIFVRALWNFKLKVLKYSRNCRFHNTLIPNLVKPLQCKYIDRSWRSDFMYSCAIDWFISRSILHWVYLWDVHSLIQFTMGLFFISFFWNCIVIAFTEKQFFQKMDFLKIIKL